MLTPEKIDQRPLFFFVFLRSPVIVTKKKGVCLDVWGGRFLGVSAIEWNFCGHGCDDDSISGGLSCEQRRSMETVVRPSWLTSLVHGVGQSLPPCHHKLVDVPRLGLPVWGTVTTVPEFCHQHLTCSKAFAPSCALVKRVGVFLVCLANHIQRGLAG